MEATLTQNVLLLCPYLDDLPSITNKLSLNFKFILYKCLLKRGVLVLKNFF